MKSKQRPQEHLSAVCQFAFNKKTRGGGATGPQLLVNALVFVNIYNKQFCIEMLAIFIYF